jgi:hypothetical protein
MWTTYDIKIVRFKSVILVVGRFTYFLLVRVLFYLTSISQLHLSNYICAECYDIWMDTENVKMEVEGLFADNNNNNPWRNNPWGSRPTERPPPVSEASANFDG